MFLSSGARGRAAAKSRFAWEGLMSSLRLLMSVLVSAAMLAACAAESEPPAAMATAEVNPVTGEGLPNPNPTRIGSWATLPEGREWGSPAGLDIDPTDGHVWGYERCGSGSAGGLGVNCDNNPVDPIFKFDRNTGEILANFGTGIFVTPHGIYADGEGNVWVTDFAGNDEGTKGHQVHKFSPTGELLLSLGIAGQPGNGPDHLNQPIDVIVAPDGSIFVADGHTGQNLTTDEQMAEARAAGLTGRIVKYSPDGEYIMEWGEIGTDHGQFRTPHALEFDAQGRLWVADRGNHRLEIFDQEGNFLEEWKQFSRLSGIFITADDTLYGAASESSDTTNPGWHRGIRVGSAATGEVMYFIPDPAAIARGTSAAEGVAVDANGNIFGAEVGPRQLARYTRERCHRGGSGVLPPRSLPSPTRLLRPRSMQPTCCPTCPCDT